MIEPRENTMSIEELRREVRQCWNREHALSDAIRDCPEMVEPIALVFLSDIAFGLREPFRRIGNAEQRRLGFDAVPPKSEYETAAGLWAIIRDALRQARVRP